MSTLKPHPNQRALETCHFKYQRFVRASSEDRLREEKEHARKQKQHQSQLGEDASSFYNEVLASKSTAKPKRNKKLTHLVVKKDNAPKLSESDLLRAAEGNDLDTLVKCLDQGLNINCLDSFGWSPLMIAACAGALDSVKLLLRRNALIDICDRSGKSALELARRKGYKDIVFEIENYGKTQLQSDHLNLSEDIEQNSFQCDTCDTTVKNVSEIKHKSSTVHQFKSGKPGLSRTVYGISEANRGFQMMLNKGWETERGLGPQGTGHKYPVKTVLKRDRKGIGSDPDNKPRITHFGANDVRSVESNPRRESQRCLNKRERKIKEESLARKTKRLRQELSDFYN